MVKSNVVFQNHVTGKDTAPIGSRQERNHKKWLLINKSADLDCLEAVKNLVARRELDAKMGTTIILITESRTHLGRKSATSSLVQSRDLAFIAARGAETKKANATVVLDVREVTLLADYFVFTGGESKAQVKAIVQEIEDRLGPHGRKAKSIVGLSEARWVVMDFGDVIVHILQSKERDFYKLEQFWNHGLVVEPSEWVSDDNLEE